MGTKFPILNHTMGSKRLILAAYLALGLAMQVRAADITTAPSTTANASTATVLLRGEINEFTQASVRKRIEQAKSAGASTIILRLNTPGGMVGPALEISRYLKLQKDVRIIAFVEEEAYSAGALIALACDEIAMQPGSFLGDCAPIVPGQKLEGAERAKIESVLLAEFRDSATRNHYDPLLAESMVQFGLVVHYIENASGERRFVNAADYTGMTEGGWKPVSGLRNPVDGPNELLTVNAAEAGLLGLSRGQYVSAEALASSRGLNILQTLEPSGGEVIIGFLNNSIVRGIVGIFFGVALLAAFWHPGTGFAEVILCVCLVLMLGVPYMTGYAQWYEILAIIIGVLLLALELFIIPGFGVAGITGICLLFLGLVLTFVPANPPEAPGVIPTLPGTMAALQRGMAVVLGGLISSLLLFAWLQRYLPRLPYFNRLILNTTSGDVLGASGGQATGIWPAIGSRGRVVTDLRPGGTVEFRDESIDDNRIADVISDSGFVAAGQEVAVREVHGTHVVVRAVEL